MDRHTTDTELLRRYAGEKSEPAFAELVRRHVDLVYSAALRLVGGDAHRAQDVTQIVFTTLARKAGSLTRHPVLAGWLYTATRHAAAKAIRGEARRHAREQEAQAMHETHSEARAIDWDRVRPVLDDAMRELNDREREAVLLRFFARRPFGEIGAALNLSEDGARMRVDRALDKLHALLARRGIRSTAAALGLALADHAVVAAPAGMAATVTGASLVGASGTLGAAAVLTFMSTGKMAATIVVLGGLAAVGFGVYEFNSARDAESAAAAARHERDALQASLRQSESRRAQAESRLREIESNALAPQKPRATAAGAAPGPGGDDPAHALLQAKIAQSEIDKKTLNFARATNPDLQRVMLQGERAGMALRFGPLYSTLNLSPDQIARFEQRLAKVSEHSIDLMAASQAKGLAQNDPAVLRLAAEEKAAFENDLRLLLGDTGFREYQDYDRSHGAREAVSSILGNLIAIGAPLSADQMNQLTRMIADRSAGYQQGARVRGRGLDVAWNDVVTDAQRLLSPRQLDVLRAAAAQAQAAQQMQEMADAMIHVKMVKPGAAVPPDPAGRTPKG